MVSEANEQNVDLSTAASLCYNLKMGLHLAHIRPECRSTLYDNVPSRETTLSNARARRYRRALRLHSARRAKYLIPHARSSESGANRFKQQVLEKGLC